MLQTARGVMADVGTYILHLINILFHLKITIDVIDGALPVTHAMAAVLLVGFSDSLVAIVTELLLKTGRMLYKTLSLTAASISRSLVNNIGQAFDVHRYAPDRAFPPLERTPATTATGRLASFAINITEEDEIEPQVISHGIYATILTITANGRNYLAPMIYWAGTATKTTTTIIFRIISNLMINYIWIPVNQVFHSRRTFRATRTVHVVRTAANTATGHLQSFPIADNDFDSDEEDADVEAPLRRPGVRHFLSRALAVMYHLLTKSVQFVVLLAHRIASRCPHVAVALKGLLGFAKHKTSPGVHVPRTVANTATGGLASHPLQDIIEDEDDLNDLYDHMCRRAAIFLSLKLSLIHCVRCLGLFVRLVVASFMPVFLSCKRCVTRCCNIFNNNTATEHVQPDESEDAAQQPADRRPSRFSETFSITVDVVAKGAQSIRALADIKMPDQFIAIGKAIGILKSDGIKSVHIPRTAENTATGALASYSLFLTQPVAVDADGDAVLDFDDDDFVPLMVPARAQGNPFKSVVGTVACGVLAAAIPHMLNGQLPRVRRSARRGVADRIALAASRG